jgi:hypothetical protein
MEDEAKDLARLQLPKLPRMLKRVSFKQLVW